MADPGICYCGAYGGGVHTKSARCDGSRETDAPLTSKQRCPHGISLTANPPCHFCEHARQRAIAENFAAYIVGEHPGIAHDDDHNVSSFMLEFGGRPVPETGCLEWRPINTAPLDESNVWVACADAMRPAFWSKHDRAWVDAVDGSCVSDRFTPTYWQPLPVLPPKASVQPEAPAGTEWPEYTTAVGEAGHAYLKSVSLDGRYHLSGIFRWYELWDALNRAARKTGSAPEDPHGDLPVELNP